MRLCSDGWPDEPAKRSSRSQSYRDIPTTASVFLHKLRFMLEVAKRCKPGQDSRQREWPGIEGSRVKHPYFSSSAFSEVVQ